MLGLDCMLGEGRVVDFPLSCVHCSQVPMFSASGVRVQYLKVWEKSSYKVREGVVIQ